ncbi:MAG: EamA/RhaT family transporter [Flectobacillus sp.]|uniref:EamA/RhaT family transporter n=1 Tax=Flectobacillus sp. TaxID=50419 RepID=UPI003B9B0DD6
MLSLILSVLFSVLLLVNFRLHPNFKVNTFQAIILNYPVCFLTGLLMLPSEQAFHFDIHAEGSLYALILGVGFVVTFILSGVSTQKMGMTATSLANNISLVIPVIFSLLFLTRAGSFDFLNYEGLALAIGAVALSTFKKEEDTASGKEKNWLLPLAVFVMYGITNTTFNFLSASFIKSDEQRIPYTLTILIGSMVFGLFVLLYRKVKHHENINLISLIAAIPLGVPNFLSFYYLLKALSDYDNNGAYVLPLYNISVIMVSSLVGIVFFKEKLTKLNYLGLLLALIAIFLINHQGFF